MRYRCVVSYRTSRSKTITTWRSSVSGRDVVSAAADAVSKLRREKRRAVTVIGIYLNQVDGAAPVRRKKRAGSKRK